MKIIIPDWSTMSAVNMDFSVFEEFGEVICLGLTRPEEAAERRGLTVAEMFHGKEA